MYVCAFFSFNVFFKGKYGDRRQELVFIGMGMCEESTRGPIVKALDGCLLTDKEMKVYESIRREVRAYKDRVPCTEAVLWLGFPSLT